MKRKPNHLNIKVKRGIGIFTMFRRVEVHINDEHEETMPLFSAREVSIPHPGSRFQAKFFSSKSKVVHVNPGDEVTIRESFLYMFITLVFFGLLVTELVTPVDLPFAPVWITLAATALITNTFVGYNYAVDVKRSSGDSVASEMYAMK